ncbi:hypothetical protein AMTRI_Chr10g225530 [Amborella trichopoda]
MIWIIWKERNLRSFEGKKKNVAQIIRSIQIVLILWGSAVGPFRASSLQESRSASWVRSPEGWLKLNFDRSLRLEDGLAGYRGLLRDSIEVVVWQYQGRSHICDINEIELRALIEGIIKLQPRDDRIIIEGDSTNVIS